MGIEQIHLPEAENLVPVKMMRTIHLNEIRGMGGMTADLLCVLQSTHTK